MLTNTADQKEKKENCNSHLTQTRLKTSLLGAKSVQEHSDHLQYEVASLKQDYIHQAMTGQCHFSNI